MPKSITRSQKVAYTEQEMVDLVYTRLFPLFTREEAAEIARSVWEPLREALLSGSQVLVPGIGSIRHVTSRAWDREDRPDNPVVGVELYPLGEFQQQLDPRHPVAKHYRKRIYLRCSKAGKPLPLWLKDYYPNYPHGYA